MDIHFLIYLVIWLVIAGGIIWCIRTIPGIPAPIPAIASIVVVLVFLLWLADNMGGSGHHFLGCN